MARLTILWFPSSVLLMPVPAPSSRAYVERDRLPHGFFDIFSWM